MWVGQKPGMIPRWSSQGEVTTEIFATALTRDIVPRIFSSAADNDGKGFVDFGEFEDPAKAETLTGMLRAVEEDSKENCADLDSGGSGGSAKTESLTGMLRVVVEETLKTRENDGR